MCLQCIQILVGSYKFYQNCVAVLESFQLPITQESKEIDPPEVKSLDSDEKLLELKCSKCLQEFKSPRALELHSKLHIDHICFFCYSGFNDEHDMKRHIEQAHKDQGFKCSICDSSFSQRKLLNRHIKLVHKITNVPIFCGYCSRNSAHFASESLLQEHLKQGHTSNSSLEVLDDMFDFDAEFLDEYLNNEISKIKVKSVITFDDDDEMQENFLRNFELVKTKPGKYNPNKMILEEFLDEVLEDDEIWTKYLKDAEEYLLEDLEKPPEIIKCEESRFQCPKCIEKYRKFVDLKIHLAHIHNDMSLVCDDCGAAFNRKENFLRHRKDHTKEEDKSEMKGDFNCNLCDKKFKAISGLKRHLKVHTDVQATHSCPYCPKKFIANSNLIDHVRIHYYIPSICCSFESCKKQFNSKDSLLKHVRSVHKSIKPFVCTECEKTFSQKSHLDDHLGKHFKKRFLCGICNHLFSTRGSLKRHLKQFHNED